MWLYCSTRAGDTSEQSIRSGPKVPRGSLKCEMCLWMGQPLDKMAKSQNYTVGTGLDYHSLYQWEA